MRRPFLSTAAAIAALLLAAGFAFGYGGGGGGGDIGGVGSTNLYGNTGTTGHGATVNNPTAYTPYCNGVTDRDSYMAERQRLDQEYEATQSAETLEQIQHGVFVSQLAWNENLQVTPGVRHLAFVLECMMAQGAIPPRHADTILGIYILNQVQNGNMPDPSQTPGAWELSAPAVKDEGTGSQQTATAPPAPAAPAAPASPPAPTTTPAQFQNDIHDHQSAQAAFQQYRDTHEHSEMSGLMVNFNDEEQVSLVISAIAWDETKDLDPATRKLAVVLESMIASGSITPRAAYAMLVIRTIGKNG
ncbi:MAG: hypothetical protein AB7E51_10550 [Pseudodesulfovibrio sp.]|jgi:hypothetical protein|uniref:hypothetical protein n=1 Tax=Pseudodesulfovibrio sp. TaxID=2035812 RepID=UPI003D0C513C